MIDKCTVLILFAWGSVSVATICTANAVHYTLLSSPEYLAEVGSQGQQMGQQLGQQRGCDEESMQAVLNDLDFLAVQYSIHWGPRARTMVFPLQDLIFDIEQHFEEDLCVPFQDLTFEKQKMYHEIWKLAAELNSILMRTLKPDHLPVAGKESFIS